MPLFLFLLQVPFVSRMLNRGSALLPTKMSDLGAKKGF